MTYWKMSRCRLSFRILATVALAGPAGCGGPEDNLPRQAVSGKVSFEGQPVAKGSIQFVPTSQEQATGVGAMIDGGSYSIARAQGPVPGLYRVMINASDPATASAAGAEGKAELLGSGPVRITKDLIPRKYNIDTKLTADVKAGEANNFDFDLKK
jgi:hypothetical protein